jgi:hypothetical protein
MKDQAKTGWIRNGMAISLGLTLVFILLRKWALTRIALGFVLAFVERWQARIKTDELIGLLSEAGGQP